jgi:hypothetical protein
MAAAGFSRRFTGVLVNRGPEASLISQVIWLQSYHRLDRRRPKQGQSWRRNGSLGVDPGITSFRLKNLVYQYVSQFNRTERASAVGRCKLTDAPATSPGFSFLEFLAGAAPLRCHVIANVDLNTGLPGTAGGFHQAL